MDQSFGKQYRLLKGSDMMKVSKKGYKIHSPSYTITFKQTSSSYSRLGITATKKFGNAVKRNRFKRVVRETFRKYVKSHPGLDFHIRTTPKTHLPTMDEVKTSFQRALENTSLEAKDLNSLIESKLSSQTTLENTYLEAKDLSPSI